MNDHDDDYPVFTHPLCLAGDHLGIDLFLDPDVGMVANDCGTCWPCILEAGDE